MVLPGRYGVTEHFAFWFGVLKMIKCIFIDVIGCEIKHKLKFNCQLCCYGCDQISVCSDYVDCFVFYEIDGLKNLLKKRLVVVAPAESLIYETNGQIGGEKNQ